MSSPAEPTAVPPGTDDAAAALAALREQLSHAYLHGGAPSYREIERRTGKALSHTTARAVLRCEKLPRWGQVELVAEALQTNPEDFKPLWVAAVRAADLTASSRSQNHGPRPLLPRPDTDSATTRSQPSTSAQPVGNRDAAMISPSDEEEEEVDNSPYTRQEAREAAWDLLSGITRADHAALIQGQLDTWRISSPNRSRILEELAGVLKQVQEYVEVAAKEPDLVLSVDLPQLNKQLDLYGIEVVECDPADPQDPYKDKARPDLRHVATFMIVNRKYHALGRTPDEAVWRLIGVAMGVNQSSSVMQELFW
ncbi:hypothetical protein [Nonomuraea sp. NEAU-A123]|uniref:hypothetical protein n=1 Tax=Nonomuraea sp. NEAU-A123 TaxID=2839649 RepID=UPI001BE4A749|nr:hypothetical protein [Nonomuraea sp. NEAU-A123]MBT2232324.1 hypothetical protein [Nonomuraea sp. NEAU-A123]